MTPANFHIVHDESDDESLVIRDVGLWDRHATITNDADGVVKRLYREGWLNAGRQLLYYDSDGVVDEIRHADGRFAGFGLVTPRRH